MAEAAAVERRGLWDSVKPYLEKESLAALKNLPEGVGVSEGIKLALKALVR